MNLFHIALSALSACHRKVIFELIRLHKKYKGCVFTLIKSIARNKRCSTKTVQRAIKKFIEIGWIKLRIIRSRQSSLFVLDDDFIKEYLEYESSRNQPFVSENVHPLSPIFSNEQGKELIHDDPPNPQRGLDSTHVKFDENEGITMLKEALIPEGYQEIEITVAYNKCRKYDVNPLGLKKYVIKTIQTIRKKYESWRDKPAIK